MGAEGRAEARRPAGWHGWLAGDASGGRIFGGRKCGAFRGRSGPRGCCDPVEGRGPAAAGSAQSGRHGKSVPGAEGARAGSAFWGGAAAVLAAAVPGRAGAQGIDAVVERGVDWATGWFVELIFAPLPGTDFPWIVLWLVVAAAVFTVYLGFIQFRGFGHALRLVRGDYSDGTGAGEVSHFQALSTALSGTVGLGNIAGVAVAIGIGGPGATFWMILAGFLGMATKFTECTLGVKYRIVLPDGTVSGGPMYYMTRGFAERGLPGGRVLAVLFALCCVGGALGGGNMFQANQAHAQIANISGGLMDGQGWLSGLVLAAVVFLVIIGGIRSIARVTSRLVPLMGLVYVAGALVVLGVNADRIIWAFGQIVEGAFTGLGVAGGMVGALIMGFRRAAFSNEAGIGSAAIAHSAVRTNEPVSEGTVALLEPFIDTVVVCTLTALVIIVSGILVFDADAGIYVLDGARIATAGGLEGVALTSAAFATVGWWFPYVLAVAVVLFALSTMITWSYYGLKAWTYLFGEGRGTELVFKLLYCGCIVIGAAAQLGAVIDFSDAMIFSMAVFNIIALYALMPVVRAEARSYFARLDSGGIAPVTRRD